MATQFGHFPSPGAVSALQEKVRQKMLHELDLTYGCTQPDVRDGPDRT